MPPKAPPGQLSGCGTRAIGLVLLLFGSVFATVGTFAVREFFSKGDYIPAALFAVTFVGIGSVAVLGGLYQLLGLRKPASPFNTSSPGTLEAHPNFPKVGKLSVGANGTRLAAGSSPGGNAFGCGCFTLIWNGIVWAIFGPDVLEKGIFGAGDVLALLIFGGLGLVALGFFVYLLLRLVLVGNTYVEVDRELVEPGGLLRVALVQPGGFAISSASMTLMCEEVARYRQGTDTVTVKHVAHSTEIVAGQGLTADRHMPILRGSVQIPADAMHSFVASNNEVRWFIRVQLRIPGRPDVDDSYGLRVRPGRS